MRAILACLVLVLSSAAWAHGEFAWIMAKPYKGLDGYIHCCGPADCDYVEDADIELTRAGYVLTYKGRQYLFSEWGKGLHVTERPDKKPVMCRQLSTDTPRCIFVKPLGS
jgi:hypothetical protein